MKPALADAYDRLMDQVGAAPLLTALAETGPGQTLPITDLLSAVSVLGGPSRLGLLRDQLMALQPLLLRIEPGTEEERVGFRHPEIAAHVRTRGQTRSTETTNDPHYPVDELSLFLDRECNSERDAELREHLEECAPCLETYGALELLKQKVARSAGGDRAPAELRNRILAGLRRTTERAAPPPLSTRARRTPEPGSP